MTKNEHLLTIAGEECNENRTADLEGATLRP
jgi:hypothetical protein